MKKTRKNAGFTLMELICTLLILVLLVMAIGVGMDTGSRIYRDATFEADSATMAGIINTSMSDVLRFSRVTQPDVHDLPIGTTLNDIPYVYTNIEYGVQRGYFILETKDGKSILQMKPLKKDMYIDLVNTGAYPDLQIQDGSFVMRYEPREDAGVKGGYFAFSYTICSVTDPTKTREVEMIVRHMND